MSHIFFYLLEDFFLFIGKQQNKRKNCKERSENLNIFIEKFSIS